MQGIVTSQQNTPTASTGLFGITLALVFLLIVFTGVVYAGEDDDAYRLYQQGKDAWNNEQINLAERLFRQAIAIKPFDGEVILNKRVRYRFASGGGRELKSLATVDGDYQSYKPNFYLGEITKKQLDVRERARLAQKQMHPPRLLAQVHITDDDGDGLFQVEESLALTIDVENRGGADATGVKIVVESAESMNGLKKHFRESVIATNGRKSYRLPFTLDREFAEKKLQVTVLVEEQDGYSSDVVRVDFPVVLWSKPVLAVIPVEQNPVLSPGRSDTLKYALVNRGKYPVRNIHVSPEIATAGIQIIDQQWSRNINLLRPGEKLPLYLVVKPDVTFASTGTYPLKMMLRDKASDTDAGYQLLADLTMNIGEAKVRYQPSGLMAATMASPVIAIADGYAPSLARNPTRQTNSYALTIGNRFYKNLDKPVPYAINDATLMDKVFEQVVGIAPEHRFTIENASLGDLRTMLGFDGEPGRLHHVVNGAEKADTVYVFYSGHGIPAKNRNWSAYLMPSDGFTDYIEQSGYSLDMLYSQLAMLNAQNVVVFMDACFSGDTPNGMLFKNTSYGTLIDTRIPQVKDNRLTVISAAGAQDMGLWFDQPQLGLFTTYLARGLAGEADKNGDKQLDTKELYSYVKGRVSSVAATMARTQTPSLQASKNTPLLTYGYK